MSQQPYEQQPAAGNAPQPPVDPAAPTQFVPVGVPGPQPQAQPMQQQPQSAQQQPAQSPAQPLQQPAFGQPPQFGDAPAFGQAPQFGQAPAFGQAPQAGQAPAFAYGGVPAQAKKPNFLGLVVGTKLGRLGILVVIGLCVWGFDYFHSVHRGSNGQITQSGQLQVTQLKIGDCFNLPASNDSVTTVQAIPCSQAHDAQVYAEPAIAESDYPGESTLQTEGKTACNTDASLASLKDAQDSLPSDVSSEVYYPEQDTFDSGTKNFSCALVGSTGEFSKSYVTTGG